MEAAKEISLGEPMVSDCKMDHKVFKNEQQGSGILTYKHFRNWNWNPIQHRSGNRKSSIECAGHLAIYS